MGCRAQKEKENQRYDIPSKQGTTGLPTAFQPKIQEG